jgi:amino acid adenylation domain-containing protein
MDRLGELFSGSVAANASRTALIDRGEGSLTYAELSDQVHCLVDRLREVAVAASDRVGVCLHKRSAGVAGILATLELRAAYVPVDVHGTVERIAYILTDSRARALFVENDLAKALAEQLSCPCEAHALDEFDMTLLVCDWSAAPATEFSEDLAIILYTSGSTGVPKGVQITHENALTFIRWCTGEFDVRPDDVCASIAPFHFDLSLFDLFVSLRQGAAVLLLDHKLVQNTLYLSSFLAEHKVTICYTTPTVLKMLLNFGRLDRYDHSSIRMVLFAGEVFPVKPLKQLREKWGQADFYNLYGPTESNVITFHPIPREESAPRERPYPIGLPCAHATCRLLLDDGEIAGLNAGLQGELIVVGGSVTPGYVGDEEKNRRAFIQGREGERFYRTGDMVSVSDAGELEFLMRKDRMVKRRGYRIELDEIEHVLNGCQGVSELAVTALRKDDETVIVACFCAEDTPSQDVSGELKRLCLDRLPAYFLPDRFIDLETLPKTSSGKIDYRGLQGLAG